MANPNKPLIQLLTETSNCCCQWAFLERYKGISAKAAAAKLGVSPRTVEEARSMVKNGALRCRKTDNCQHKEKPKC
jgi:Mn-dependent DtxR family transcriptional regulator